MVPPESDGVAGNTFPEESSVSLIDIAAALMPHRLLIVLCAVAGSVLAMAYTVYQPTLYTSRANFVVARYNPVSRATGSQLQQRGRFLGAFYDPANQKELIAQIFQSRRFIRAALDDIYDRKIDDPEAMSARIAGNLDVSYDEEAPHLSVSYTSARPEEPVKVLGGLLKAFPAHLARQIRTNLETTLETARRLLAEEDFAPSKHRELQQRIQEIQHALIVEEVTGEKFSISVIDAPGLSRHRTSVLTASGLGLAIGLILGIMVALAIETLDTRLHTAEEIEDHTGLQILGNIPKHGSPEETPSILEAPRSPFSEAIRLLRANFKFKDVEQSANILLITSPLEGEGKSTVAYNLAQAYTLEGTDTLLADFDLRRGKIHRMIGSDRSPGVTSLILGEASLEEAVCSDGDLDVLPTGELPPNPAELMASSQLGELLDQFRERYDRVVLDGTPVIGLADMIELSQRVDSVLMVFRAEQTNAGPAGDALEDLREVGAPMTGAIFNSIPPDGRAYYSGYRYYYDSYYYEQEEARKA